MEFFQPGARLLRNRGTTPAEVVQFLHLAEELDCVVHAIDAKLQAADVVAVNGDGGLLAGQVRAFTCQREEGLGVGLILRAQRRDQRATEQKCDDGAIQAHQSAPRRMFQR
jgi:hypothetical protein